MNPVIKRDKLESEVSVGKTITYNFRLDINDRLSEAFNVIPSNTIINKGRCGIGGTYLEIEANRNSIIVVPTNAIIDDKCFDKAGDLLPGYHVVRGKGTDTKKKDLEAFMLSDIPKKKIFTTPEGVYKIMTCGVSEIKIYKEWFLLLDESHTAITDSFREYILTPFRYLFNFHNKSLISATPYEFSDPRLKEFNVININFNAPVGTIHMLGTNNVQSVLYTKLTHLEDFPGNLHIFLNSIVQIREVIIMSGITDCNIFCNDDNANRITLDELQTYISKVEPKHAAIKTVNFYTSKYFEGWDLEDANSTTIIVSDCRSKTLKSGISNKCVQAAGRNRKTSNQIIHITNHRNEQEFKPLKTIERETLVEADLAISAYNRHLAESNAHGVQLNKKISDASMEYGDQQYKTREAYLVNAKVDQIVNGKNADQEFNHINYIKKAWQSASFRAILTWNHAPKIPIKSKLKIKSNKIKVTIEYLEVLNKNNSNDFPHYKELEKFLPTDTEDIRTAFYEIGPELIKNLQYKWNLIRKAVIKSQNNKKRLKIKEDYFAEAGYEKQSNEFIENCLGRLYRKHQLFDENATKDIILIPKAVQISKPVYFTKVKKCKLGDNHEIHGFRIVTY
eukprot:TRINITY_DN3522_c0_g1_i2.p1 TRINITY_DN3522_c0_g1~~TRINITY_DN3522_c0_g1_i2.p1  ORF type:complete len:620 (-),score=14.29 TRINITY_DN3522_c0_g1_i2:2807-4666(-)